ncbi:hypothetical protein [Rhizobium leguminosarum]|uniref:hypothetical protein n=1 Tax=Rhizobium leguminosarum TaxID=384 RepID=UPI001C96F476|nr:hypothetical protein [Rhizobium leguminosarum]MBY5646376.1 hypothetical protein [Rhizobium leguminosarum]
MKLIYGSVGVRIPDVPRMLRSPFDQWAIPQRGTLFAMGPAKTALPVGSYHTTTGGAGGSGGAHVNGLDTNVVFDVYAL